MRPYKIMLVAIISDVHNNTVNLEKVLNYCKNNEISTIICCGDLASEETSDFLNDNFDGTIYYTFGNMDNEQLLQTFSPAQGEGAKKYRNTYLFKNFGEVEIENKNIAFVHFPEVARELCESGKYDFVFYGHTHKPWSAFVKTSADKEEPNKGCAMLNPGNVAGEIYLPTFAVWNTENDKFQLIRIHNLK